MKHPLDEWFAGLRKVECGAIVAYTGADAGIKGEWPWPPEEVRLLRMIFRFPDSEVREFLEDHYPDLLADYEDLKDLRGDLGEAAVGRIAAWGKSWFTPLTELLSGTSLQVVEPEVLFSVTFGITGMVGWIWGWTVTALTAELAVFSQWQEEDFPNENMARPLGVVSRRDIFRSAALLVSACETCELLQDRFGDRDNFWHEVYPMGIDLPNLYRILLCATRHGGEEVITMGDDEVARFKNESMVYAFPDLERVVAGTLKNRRRMAEKVYSTPKENSGSGKVKLTPIGDWADIWAGCLDSSWMLWMLQWVPHGASELRLFACLCARQAWKTVEYEHHKEMVELAERFSRDRAGLHEMVNVWKSSGSGAAGPNAFGTLSCDSSAAARLASFHTCREEASEAAWWAAYYAAQSAGFKAAENEANRLGWKPKSEEHSEETSRVKAFIDEHPSIAKEAEKRARMEQAEALRRTMGNPMRKTEGEAPFPAEYLAYWMMWGFIPEQSGAGIRFRSDFIGTTVSFDILLERHVPSGVRVFNMEP